jgi:choline dehydrogenase-like flavoprotein
MPGGPIVPEPDEGTIDRFEKMFGRLNSGARGALRSTLWAIEIGAVAWRGQRFSRLSEDARLTYLEKWHNGVAPRRMALRALLSPLKLSHFDNPKIFEAMNCVYAVETPKQVERARWRQNAMSLKDFAEDEELEADVVVIGTGAGGAAMAKELAEAGLAVAMIEAGDYFTRVDFDGRAPKALDRMYYGGGMVFSFGNTPIAIPTGKTVGGSTTVNSGTCFRVPDRILDRWRREFGLRDFTPEAMAPHFDRVEQIIEVQEAKKEYLGGCGRVIARGCDALGYSGHGALRRNAPECDGQGLCCFGCPTDAKRSTNVTYVPLALQAHASLFYQARVSEILIEGGRAVGVVAEARVGHNGTAQTRRLTIRAKAVVVSCGTYGTPMLLLKAGLANGSGQLGRNLSLHPAVVLFGDFEEEINGWDAIPQGYYIDEFTDEHLMFEGGFTPLDLGSAAHAIFGPTFTKTMERFNHLAAFGFMVEDTSRGRLRIGPGGSPLVLYSVNKTDLKAMRRGMEILSEIYFAAGATSVYPPVHGHDILRSFRDLQKFRQAKISATDLTLSAFHPLGTARLGMEPKSSVVGPDHQCHDVPGLYIVDGSSLPSSLGVNPQVTIMAMATRAAGLMAERLG